MVVVDELLEEIEVVLSRGLVSVGMLIRGDGGRRTRGGLALLSEQVKLALTSDLRVEQRRQGSRRKERRLLGAPESGVEHHERDGERERGQNRPPSFELS